MLKYSPRNLTNWYQKLPFWKRELSFPRPIILIHFGYPSIHVSFREAMALQHRSTHSSKGTDIMTDSTLEHLLWLSNSCEKHNAYFLIVCDDLRWKGLWMLALPCDSLLWWCLCSNLGDVSWFCCSFRSYCFLFNILGIPRIYHHVG